ncbi:cell division protein FtsQ [Propionicimonas paludicola]|uniref:Cell division protein FtsQ n=1 Tax=Propionicimonas paludicola TaxID=185243 RepID=A0A2A9CR90_9ACTN|nr:FtsQ-type POTRA domain-containing protein [Propionicimonas paludicola]PFG16967.1 cell division protein FtsQ [Propionicimonas paludicola]
MSLSDATTRLDLRRRQERQHRWLRIGGIAVAALALAAVAYLVWFSPVFAAREITVTGNKLLSKTDVVAAAQVVPGTPMARLDVDAIADRVAGLPAVARVTVSRDWPDRLTLAITERTAHLSIPAGAGYLIADESGVVFQAVPDQPSGLVRVVADPSNQGVLADVGAVFSALSDQQRAQVNRLEAPSRDGIVLRMRDGAKVIWGSADESSLKSQVLARLLPLGGDIFDVSAPAFPARR